MDRRQDPAATPGGSGSASRSGDATPRRGESVDPSSTGPRRPARFESYAAGRDEGMSESFQSFQSTDTVRRRPDDGYGSISGQPPNPHFLSDQAHTRSNPALLGPERAKASTSGSRKPPMTRRTTNPQAPHRGAVFSAEDDVSEVESTVRNRKQQQQPSGYGTNRRTGPGPGPGTLSRVHSHRSEHAEEPVETPLAEDDDDHEDPPEDSSDNHEEEDLDCDSDSDVSDAESFTLKDRQQAINETHPFGIRLWKPALYKKDRSVQKNAESDIHSSPGLKVSRWLLFFNFLWTVIFGWWMAIFAALGALVCLFFAATPSGREYGRILWGLAGYLFYPFGKFVRLEQDEAYMHEDQGEGRSISEYEQWQSGDLEYGRLFFGPDRGRSIVGRSRRSIDSEPDETDSLLDRSRRGERSETPPRLKRRLFGRGQWNIGRIIFFAFFYALLTPSLIIVSLICWFLVFTIPMGKVTMLLFDHLRRHPLALSFESEIDYTRISDGRNHSSILLCTYRAVGTRYWKYTVDGTNIFLINLMAVVMFVILDWLILEGVFHFEIFITSPGFLFVAGLLSIIPLAYFIGQAVASISAQSSMGMGAAVNAFFATVVEVFLYCVALKQGKGRLVEGSIVGSIFAGILFLPGLSMCCGAIKRKTQRFNAKSAGVTSTMLLFAVIGAFGPTLFYQIYGSHELNCLDCLDYGGADSPSGPRGDSRDCQRCFFSQAPALNDRFYLEAVRPFCYFCACLLFLSYIVGLWFTLRTHAAVIWNTEADEKKQEEQQHSQHSQPSARPSGHHSAAETTGIPSDIRESQLYRRILGQSLKQVGLQPRAEDVTRQGSTLTATSANSGVAMPHQVPPKDGDAGTGRPGVHLTGFSDADNNTLVREVTEIAATAATYAARDARLPRRTSGLPNTPAQNQPPPPQPTRAATFHEGEDALAAAHAGGNDGHDAPNWGRLKSSVILLGATLLYAIVAEILVDTVDVVLEGFAIDEKFLGITLFALVPNTTEFLNAISFAMNGNIALSMEIGSAYALQVCLLQVPALVLFSATYPLKLDSDDQIERFTFSLLFPQWDMVLVILCVFLLSHMYGEGKSNYFKGSILLLSYFVVIVGYYFSGYSQDAMGAARFDIMGDDGVFRNFKTIGRRSGTAIEV